MKNKKLIKIIVAVVLVVAIFVGSAIFIHTKTSDKFEAVIMTVGTSTIKQTLSTQGVVESMNRGEYRIYDGVIVKEVLVNLGDKVEEGQLLATFDAASLNGIVSGKQSAYDSAKINYYNAINSANEASARLPGVIAEIAQLEKEIEKLAADAEKESGSQSQNSADVPGWVNEIDYNSLVKILGNNYTVEELREFFAKLALRGVDRTSITNLINGFKSGASLDITSMLGASTAETKLMSAQMSLMGLKAQKALLETQAQNLLEPTYKSLMDTAKLELDATKDAVKKLSNGWYAEGAGVVSELNIVAGQPYTAPQSNGGMDMNAILGLLSGGASATDITGLLSAFSGASSTNVGLAVEYYDSFVASFTLGKYDVLDVSVGQKATVNSLGHVLEGEVIFISPVASSSGGLDIGSMFGGGTSTGSSNTIPAKVRIINPDESVIIGIDVDIDIELDSVEQAVVVPIEAVETDDTGNYVYLFNEDKQTVTRVPVELGLATDTQYQVVSGCSVGDKIVQNPATALKEIAEEGKKVAAVYADDTAV